MAEIKLNAKRRAGTGKGAARRTRAAGKVPAVVYGEGMQSVAIEVDRREFVTALLTDAGMNVLLDLDIEGATTLALTRELQRDPVRGTLLHADFIKVDRTHEIEVEVPVHIAGDAPGAKEGGVVEHPLFTLHVRCLPGDVPEAIEADVSGLGIGDTLRVFDLRVAGEYTILNDPESVVVSIAAPITEAELEAMEAAAAAPAEEPEIEESAEAAQAADDRQAAPTESPDEATS